MKSARGEKRQSGTRWGAASDSPWEEECLRRLKKRGGRGGVNKRGDAESEDWRPEEKGVRRKKVKKCRGKQSQLSRKRGKERVFSWKA